MKNLIFIVGLFLSSCSYDYYCVDGKFYREGSSHNLKMLDISHKYKCVPRVNPLKLRKEIK